MSRLVRFLLLFGIAFAICCEAALAQDLQPRAFSPAPVGLNTVLVGYALSSGNVFFDQALLIEDATGEVNGITVAYVRTFGIFGKLAKLSAVLPYAFGTWEGTVNGVPATTSREGFADPHVGLAVNFIGSRAVHLKDFRTYNEGTIVGADVIAVLPLGQYDPTKLINLGSDRWAVRPRLGFSSRIYRLTLEANTAVWLFSDIPEAYGGTTISQEPIWSLSGNVLYIFKSGIWGGVSWGMASGGKTVVNGIEKDNAQSNSRLAATFAIPINKKLILRFFYINSVTTALGTDFDFYNISIQYTWGAGF
jgi:hypothetical protein